MSENRAPVALFAYKRPEHLTRTLQALIGNIGAADTDLHIFLDGPKTAADTDPVLACREIAKSARGFKSVELHIRESNLGLAGSIIGGVTELVQQYRRVIVLEDDLVTSPYFLKFMNDGLTFFEKEERVACLHGYCYPFSRPMTENFFIRGGDCWGWATWDRAWKLFEPEGRKLYRELKDAGLAKAFDLDGAADYMGMLKDQFEGRNNSWAVRWHGSLFLKNRLTFYPKKSLVTNIGFDNSGTHCSESDIFDVTIANEEVPVKTLPIEQSEEANALLKDFFQRTQKGWKKKLPYPLRSIASDLRERLRAKNP